MAFVPDQAVPPLTDAQSAPASLPGVDEHAIAKWIEHAGIGLRSPLRWTPLRGGHSNLTYRIDDAEGCTVVLRRPPLGLLQPGAHDTGREYSILSALWPTGVQVARPLAHCDDPSVTGATFLLMSFVEGRGLERRDDVIGFLGEGEREKLSESYIDTLAALHAVDPLAAGLSTLAKTEDFVGRQLRAWHRSWTTSAPDAGYDDPRIHELRDLLEAKRPEEGPARVVHGDCGLNNCMVTSDGAVAALVDWEVCTLGQPLHDLAFALNRWSTPGDPIEGREDMATDLPGFLDREHLQRRYAERTGTDLGALPFYTLLNHWRSACIAHGVYTRYVRGQRSAAGVDIERFRTAIDARLRQAEQAASDL